LRVSHGRQGADSGALTDLATHHGFRTAESQELLNRHCERALPQQEEDDAALGRGRGVALAFQIAPSAFILKV
jgi:hypothetical protein